MLLLVSCFVGVKVLVVSPKFIFLFSLCEEENDEKGERICDEEKRNV